MEYLFLGYTYKINHNKIIIKCSKKNIIYIKKKLKYLKNNNYEKYLLSISSYYGYIKRSNIKRDLYEMIKY